jgi:hypothetical protein
MYQEHLSRIFFDAIYGQGRAIGRHQVGRCHGIVATTMMGTAIFGDSCPRRILDARLCLKYGEVTGM